MKQILSDIDGIFLQELNPFYHFIQANSLKNARKIEPKFTFGNVADEEGLICKELMSGFNDVQKSGMRFIRYHAVETLILILCGSWPHGPTLRFVGTTNNAELNQIISDLGNKKIPTSLSIKNVSDFNQWVSIKFFGAHISDVDSYLSNETIDFISIQAQTYSDKSAYNAFKHGCRIGKSGLKLKVEDKEVKDFETLFEIKNPISWYRWFEKKTEIIINIGVVECDPEDDHNAIFIMAILVRAMKQARLSTDLSREKFQLPIDIKTKPFKPQQMTVRFKFDKPDR